MSFIEIIILGIIQGLTEFLPISSSGHLVLAKYFMDINTPGVLIELILHLGTLLSVIIFYKNDIIELIADSFKNKYNSRQYVYKIIIAIIPVILIGFLFRELIESTFTISVVKYMFLITGIVVGMTYFCNKEKNRELVLYSVIIIGLFQIFSLLPGISRSGITISAALLLGIKHEKAAKFSFFMAIPLILGAALLPIFEGSMLNNTSLSILVIGFLSSFFTGILVIKWLLSIIVKGKFYIFSIYCFVLSIIIFFFI